MPRGNHVLAVARPAALGHRFIGHPVLGSLRNLRANRLNLLIEHRQNLFADFHAGRGNRNVDSAVAAAIIAKLDGILFRFRKRDAHQFREATLAARQPRFRPNLVVYVLLLQNRADRKAETVQIAFLRGDIIALVRHIDRSRIHVHVDGFLLARHLVLIELVIVRVLLNLVGVQVVDVHLRRLFSRLHCAERAAQKQPNHAGQQQNLPFLENILNHLNEINLFLFVSYFLSIRRLIRHVFSPRSISVVFYCIRSACFRTVCSPVSASRFPHFLMYSIYHPNAFPSSPATQKSGAFRRKRRFLCQQIPKMRSARVTSSAVGAGTPSSG